jgi:hypothetical protein
MRGKERVCPYCEGKGTVSLFKAAGLQRMSTVRRYRAALRQQGIKQIKGFQLIESHHVP